MQGYNTALLRNLDDLMAGSGDDIAAAIDAADDTLATHLQNTLADRGRTLMASQEPADEPPVAHLVSICLNLRHPALQVDRLNFLLDAAGYYHAIARNQRALAIAKTCLAGAEAIDDARLLRRSHSALGAICLLIAEYQEAAEHLEQAFALSLQANNRGGAAVALLNATGLLMQMGLYRDGISAARAGLTYTDDTPTGRAFRLQLAGNGLYCAHRLRDHAAALEFLQCVSSTRTEAIDPVSRAELEYTRAIYLIDANDAETAAGLLHAARTALLPSKNPRVEIALDLADSLCGWATRDADAMRRARTRLRELYHLSRQANIQHDDVLLALMRVYGTAVTPEEAKIGMQYARELVEYTTKVKKAKFYHQLALRGVEVVEAQAADAEPAFDPFDKLRRMLTPPPALTATQVGGARAGKVCETNEELTAIHGDLARIRMDALRGEIRSTAYNAAENWAVAAEFYDDNTGEHCFRVGYMAGMLARALGMDDEYCARIEHASRLHDIGKVAVNEMILLKPGPLNPVELTAMREHTNVGAELLAGTVDPTLKIAAEIARHHHEWWNGAGYPAGFSMTEIPLSARICALADVYDALTHARTYKQAWTHAAAVQEIQDLAGLQFDPSLVPTFLRVVDHIAANGAMHGTSVRGDAGSNGIIEAKRGLVEAIEATTR